MTEELISQEKFEELTRELDELRTTRRREIAEQLEYARSLGDLSENAEYHEAREMQAAVEERIGKLESILKNAKIVRGGKSGTVSMGSTVTVERIASKADASAGSPTASRRGKDSTDAAGGKHTYTIVGAEEADILSGKVSYHSPLGSALMGKKKGDEFSFHTPKGTQKYKILKVE